MNSTTTSMGGVMLKNYDKIIEFFFSLSSECREKMFSKKKILEEINRERIYFRLITGGCSNVVV